MLRVFWTSAVAAIYMTATERWKIMIRRTRVAVAIVAVAIVAAACSGASSSSSSTTSASGSTPNLGTLRVSMVPNVFATGLPWVADQLGYFNKLGLTVNFAYSGSGPSSTQAWLAGAADLNAGSGLNPPSLSDQHVDYTVVSGVGNLSAYQVMERKGLNAPAGNLAALKGSKVCSLGTLIDTIFRALANDAGLSTSDLTLIEFQSFPAIVAAISQGQCDFTIGTAPFTQEMVANGATVWRDIGKDGPANVRQIPSVAVVGQTSYVKAHEKQMTAFVTGMAEAAKLAKTNPTKVIAAAEAVIKPADTAAFAEQAPAILASFQPDITAAQINYTNHLLVDVEGLNHTKPSPAKILWPQASSIYKQYGLG
jgi:ABC-type nitrate/sulfonate/bicarbonate transport system substrate-binding protein